ncbi:hypothetical protein O181_063192 [Austropuccinia psidii MF-1]|uniref:Uncharacterized protein n=1 Tax=Austropuccinia psidii MF-1 TaxID=1389203 RepID=A0A9Q3EP43_9BASI|nr:hypothetical protein [Austropuccinia psidii MF-1]
MIPVHHSPPSKNTRAQRNQAVLNPTARDSLDCTPSVHKLSENLDTEKPTEASAPFRRGGMRSTRSRSFFGLLGGFRGIFQGPRSIFGQAEDE